MEFKSCPFCGGKMERGGLCLDLRTQLPAAMRWVPIDSEETYALWGDVRSFDLIGTLEEENGARPISAQLFSTFPETEAWYCPDCERAVAVFQKAEGHDPFPHVSDGLLPSTWDILHPKEADRPQEETPAPPKPRRGKEPWEKKGLFRRKKDKPDWEL